MNCLHGSRPIDETATRITFNGTLAPFDFLRAQDFDRDGDVDLFTDDRFEIGSGEYAWRNVGGGVFTPYQGRVVPAVAIFIDGFEQ
jgi:hypothetical protein